MCECNEHIQKLEGTERFGMREQDFSVPSNSSKCKLHSHFEKPVMEWRD
ncbi:MAG: hypothetical protein KAS67_00840 [Thermoplasmata archaeon]|nr:hypothetical protein [Thermoplasmata archaeon]